MAKNERSEGEDASASGPLLGTRHLQTFLFFSGVSVAYTMRVNISVAIVAMMDKNSKDFVEYSSSEKSLILSSFFWGYIITQIPGGHFSRKFGAKSSLLISVTISSVMALITPVCALMGDWRLPVAVRMVQGLSQGVLFPATHTLLAKWAPKEERAILGTLAYCGSQFGTVVIFAGSGFIASSSLGWPGIFYISGGSGLIWVVVWYIWGSSAPSEHKSITIAERTYIEKSISNSKHEESTPKQHHPPTPWMQFFTSAPFWALLITQLTFMWGFWTMATQIPSYMNSILKFNIKSNALLTSLPYFAMLLLNFVFGGFAALISKRKWLSLTGNRKLFNTLATWVPAVALAGLGYLDANHAQLAVFLLTISVGFGAGIHMGFMINHIDLSPNFAGIMMGFMNMVANVMSILAPLAVGVIVTDEENPIQWRIVFFIAAGFCFFGNLLFVLCGSAEVQPFNEPDRLSDEELKPMNKEPTAV